MDKNNIKIIGLIIIILLGLQATKMVCSCFGLKSKDIVMLCNAKDIINLSIPDLKFIDKKLSKRNSLKEEISEIKNYILGIGNKTPRDIVEIQFGINRYLNIQQKCVEPEISSTIYVDEINKNDYLTSGEIKISNETGYKIDIEELLKEPLCKNITKDSKILVYHTHTNESYVSDITKINDISIPPRSEDENINVIKVGDELCNNFLKLGYSTIHSKKYHNVPKDKGAYARSLNTVEEYIKKDPDIEIVLDIHRDGISDSKKLREVSKIDNKDVAKIMFVVGTDSTGLSHKEWRENLKFAIKLQKKLISYNPDIVKPIFISKNRYNQHLTNFSLIIEIGGDGNVITESMESTKYIAKALDNLICND